LEARFLIFPFFSFWSDKGVFKHLLISLRKMMIFFPLPPPNHSLRLKPVHPSFAISPLLSFRRLTPFLLSPLLRSQRAYAKGTFPPLRPVGNNFGCSSTVRASATIILAEQLIVFRTSSKRRVLLPFSPLVHEFASSLSSPAQTQTPSCLFLLSFPLFLYLSDDEDPFSIESVSDLGARLFPFSP